MASLICSLSPKNTEHQKFAVNLLRELSQQYKIVQEESFAPGTITNSFIHRKKHRLLQIVLLLEPFIDEVCMKILLVKVINNLLLDRRHKTFKIPDFPRKLSILLIYYDPVARQQQC